MERQTGLLLRMMEHEEGCPQRVHHFLKVLSFAAMIGELEGLDAHTRLVLETAAIVHDAGIRPSLAKYGSAAGKHQEAEGPPVARPMLESLGYKADVVERVCYLIARHHTYAGIDGMDYQILVEADFLVNVLEDGMTREAAERAYADIFRTRSGKRMFARMYLDGDAGPGREEGGA